MDIKEIEVGDKVSGQYDGKVYTGTVIEKKFKGNEELKYGNFIFNIEFDSPIYNIFFNQEENKSIFIYQKSPKDKDYKWCLNNSILRVISQIEKPTYRDLKDYKEKEIEMESKKELELDLNEAIKKKVSKIMQTKTKDFLNDLAELLRNFGVYDVRVHDKFQGLTRGMKDFLFTLSKSNDGDYRFTEGMVGNISLPAYLWTDEEEKIKKEIVSYCGLDKDKGDN